MLITLSGGLMLTCFNITPKHVKPYFYCYMTCIGEPMLLWNLADIKVICAKFTKSFTGCMNVFALMK